MNGSLAVYADDSQSAIDEIPFTSRSGKENRFLLDVKDRQPSAIRVVLTNTDDAEGLALVLSNETSVLINQQHSSFFSNLLRTILILFCKLSLVAAVGVSCGSVFALPVAGFTAGFILCMPILTGLLEESVNEADHHHHHHHGHEHEESMIEEKLEEAYLSLNEYVAPLRGYHPLEQLPRGEHIPWNDVRRCAIWYSLVYSGFAAFFGIWIFKHRELGLV